MPKYEYEILVDPNAREINEYAAKGYRVIAVVYNADTENVEVYLERPNTASSLDDQITLTKAGAEFLAQEVPQ